MSEEADSNAGASDAKSKVSVSYSADIATLRSEQVTEKSLKPCFVLARQGRGGSLCVTVF
jgi:hypothetical protein